MQSIELRIKAVVYVTHIYFYEIKFQKQDILSKINSLLYEVEEEILSWYLVSDSFRDCISIP